MWWWLGINIIFAAHLQLIRSSVFMWGESLRLGHWWLFKCIVFSRMWHLNHAQCPLMVYECSSILTNIVSQHGSRTNHPATFPCHASRFQQRFRTSEPRTLNIRVLNHHMFVWNNRGLTRGIYIVWYKEPITNNQEIFLSWINLRV